MSKRAHWMPEPAPKHVVRHGTAEWGGKTKREAEVARDEDLARLFALIDPLRPALVVGLVHGPEETTHFVVGMVHPTPSGWWTYRIGTMSTAGVTSWSNCRYAHDAWDDVEAERRCRRHLAQNAYRHGESSGLDLILPDDHEGRREHESWIRFQDAYHAALAEGATDEVARERAFSQEIF